MLERFEQELPEGTTWSRPEGGYFTWVDFPEGTDAGRCSTRRPSAASRS
jgi:2-aminoadipate transaminase